MKNRVLVFPCGSEIGLEINRALAYSTHVELYGASTVSSNHGKYVYKNYIEGVPQVDSPDFIENLNSVIDRYGIDFVIPAHDSVVLKLAERKDDLHCKVVTSPEKTCRICRSKGETYRYFLSELQVPKVYQSPDCVCDFPVFLKPDIGQGSRGVHIAENRGEIGFYLAKDPSLLILEYLPGKEYTIDCFTDKNGKLRFVGGRERVRVSNGISVDAKLVSNPEFERIAGIINGRLEFRGVWFFQLKEDSKGNLVLLEIAPRIAGTMGFYRNLGVNFALLSIFDQIGMDVAIDVNSHCLEMDRALVSRYKLHYEYENVYIDLDDTIVFEKEVNPFIIAFLYQCLNKGKKVHLITRHDGDLVETLHQYRINDLFSKVIHISREEDKANHITEMPAIFIDDSFSERHRVSRKLGIPAFDINSVESLLDWRV